MLATFSAVQLVFASGAAAIAFGLRKTFEGGIFERPWRVIAISPIPYALAQAIELVQATQRKSQAFGVVASVFEVAFLIILFSGFFMFASAWGGNRSKEGAASPPEREGEAYANSAKGAMVFFLGKTGASRVMFYTGEPDMADFESRLHGVLGNGASAVIRRMAEERAEKEGSPETPSRGETNQEG